MQASLLFPAATDNPMAVLNGIFEPRLVLKAFQITGGKKKQISFSNYISILAHLNDNLLLK